MISRLLCVVYLALLCCSAPSGMAGDVTVFQDRFSASCLSLSVDGQAFSPPTRSLTNGQRVTIASNSTCPFGDVGPELIFLLDVSPMTPGPVDRAVIRLCDTCTLDGGESHTVAISAAMPGGSGLVMGASGDSLNPTGTPRYRVSHPNYTRGFDSRITYWPEAHQQAAIPYLLGAQPGYEPPATWQIKPIWNMADGNYGSGDTDFFLAGPNAWYPPGEYFKSGRTIASNSVGTYYLPGGERRIQRPRSELSLPFAEPYVIEYGWDQGSLSEAYDAFVDVGIGTSEQGTLYRHLEEGVRLHVVGGPTKQVNYFTYPGFIRGYSRTLGLHRFEGEVYKAGGPGAFARVALADAPYYYQAKRRTLLEPLSWSSDEIQVRLRGGWFDLSDLSGVYLIVMDADNQQVAYRAL